MNLMNHSSWDEHFIFQGNTNRDVSPTPFLEVSKPVENEEAFLSKLTSNNGDSILIYFSKISKSIHVLYNVCNIGNSNSHPSPLLVALSGLRSRQAFPLLVDRTISLLLLSTKTYTTRLLKRKKRNSHIPKLIQLHGVCSWSYFQGNRKIVVL